jgi:hypothetical protein
MKISFCDFWDGFQENNNFFLDIFKSIYKDVELSSNDECEILIYSCFGNNHHKFDKNKKIKIFYTGENLRPNFNECSFSFTFDFDSYDERNIRIPLWLLQIDWFNKKNYGNPQYVIPLDHLNNNPYPENKEFFCSMVVNNFFPERKKIYSILNAYKEVKTVGKPWNNWIYGEDEKFNIINKGKFNICFENTKFPGYFTEKPIHARVARTIPVYYADRRYEEDFNKKAFIFMSDFSNETDLMNQIKKIDESHELFLEYINQPIFNTPTYHIDMLEKIKQLIKYKL